MAKERIVLDIFDLRGKIAVVTGGYGHLGEAITLALWERGATVIVGGRSLEKFNSKFETFPSDRLIFTQLDISRADSVTYFFTTVEEQYGKIDVLINNAHYIKGSGKDSISDEDWAYSMDGVLGSAYRCIKEVTRIMKKQSYGKIINIASMYGVVSPNFELYEGEDCEKYTNPPHYGAAKAGMIQLTKYFANYLGEYNINVNAITPGPFPNPKIQQENPKFIERLKARNPMQKIGEPKDIQGLVVLLSSAGSDFITGQNFIVDGGWTTW